MKDRLRAEAAEKERQEKEAARQAQLQAAIQIEEKQRTQFVEQKKVQEAARAQVDQEISQGMERLRLEKQRETKAPAPAPAPRASAAPVSAGQKSPVTPAAGGTGESLEDPFIRQTLADIYAKQGLFVEALKIYERILNEDPDNEDVKEKLRNILKMKGI
jgi:translation initiation factor IF-2